MKESSELHPKNIKSSKKVYGKNTEIHGNKYVSKSK